MTLESAELEVLRNSLRDFLAQFHPVQGTRDVSSEAGARVWAGLSDQLGVSGLGIAERYGGAGAEPEARQLVLEELGRTLVPGPAFSTLAVSRLIALSGDGPTPARLLPEIAAGRSTAGFTVSKGVVARPDGMDRWRLFGEVHNAVEGSNVDFLFLLATPAAGASPARAFLVEAMSPGLSITPVGTADPTRQLATLVLDGAEGTALAELDARRAVAILAQDLALEQLGGARWCLEATRDYAKIRSQFGRTIGSFQAVKHMLAEVVLENEAAWAAAIGSQAEPGDADKDVLVGSIVHTLASEAYLRAAGVAVQVHGAIAITDETDVHLHLKRALTGRQMLGGMSHHYENLFSAVLASR